MNNINSDFIKMAVIGNPVAHSKSPLIHNEWLRKYELNGFYKAIDIKANALSDGVKALVERGYAGFNVTLPHKIAIMDLCDEIDEHARSIGAVNTVSIRDDKLYGTNTDSFGFAQNILSATNLGNWSFKDGTAVVLGAGGAARAVLYALLEEGVPSIILLNRTREKAEKLARMNKRIKVADWGERNVAIENASLIVNTTSLGMEGKPPLEIDLSFVPASALVTDIVYAPLMTDLLKQARARNLRYVTGIGMLLHQARRGFELWNGILPEVTPELEKKVLRS